MSQGPANHGRSFGKGFANDDVKEQVRQATDIVDLVGGYLQLRRQGRNYVGLCPWHDDSKPSLQVNPERQTFKCWVCDLGGDVFSFLMKMDNLEFREALEQLADRAGIALARQGPAAAPGSPGDKKTLLAAAAWAEEQFARCLLTDPAAEPARRYLLERGISQESVTRFRLGFAPDRWDWLLGKARATSFSPDVLERIGLVRPRQQGDGHYDFYRGRVIFPIRDVRSRPIAFGGRILPAPYLSKSSSENAGGKYINSPETPLFSKSNQLYALDLARDAIASEQKIVVAEGYTDVIMAHQHGVENVVAVLGTALGEKHLPLIRRFTDRIVLVLDGDEAGQRRTNEVLELFVANQVDLRILGLPGGLDPCDFIATPDGATSVAGGEAKDGLADSGRGPEAFRRLVDQAPDALEHKMQTVTNGLVASADTHAIAQAVEQFLATLSKVRVGDGASAAMIREQSLLGRLARWAQLPEVTLRQRLVDLRRSAKNRFKPAIAPPVRSSSPDSSPEQAFAEAGAADAEGPGFAPPDPTAPLDTRLEAIPPRERELLELLLAGDAPARRVLGVVRVEELASPAAVRVHKLCSELLLQRGSIAFGGLLDAADETLKNLLVSIDDQQQKKSESSLEQRVDDLVAAFTRVKDESHRRGAVAALRGDQLDNEQKEEVLNELFAKLKDRQTGPLSMEG